MRQDPSKTELEHMVTTHCQNQSALQNDLTNKFVDEKPSLFSVHKSLLDKFEWDEDDHESHGVDIMMANCFYLKREGVDHNQSKAQE